MHCAELLDELWMAACQESAKQTQQVANRFVAGVGFGLASGGSEIEERSRKASARLLVGFKSFFFVARAFQDHSYRVLLELLGHKSSSHSSMSRVLSNPDNPVARLIQDKAPEYLMWFSKFRDQRNLIKEGTGSGLLGPDENLGVTFTQFTEDGGLVIDFAARNAVRMSDLKEALTMSRRVYELIRELGKDGEDSNS